MILVMCQDSRHHFHIKFSQSQTFLYNLSHCFPNQIQFSAITLNINFRSERTKFRTLFPIPSVFLFLAAHKLGRLAHLSFLFLAAHTLGRLPQLSFLFLAAHTLGRLAHLSFLLLAAHTMGRLAHLSFLFWLPTTWVVVLHIFSTEKNEISLTLSTRLG